MVAMVFGRAGWLGGKEVGGSWAGLGSCGEMAVVGEGVAAVRLFLKLGFHLYLVRSVRFCLRRWMGLFGWLVVFPDS